MTDDDAIVSPAEFTPDCDESALEVDELDVAPSVQRIKRTISPDLERLLVSPDEAAQMLKIGRSKIYELLYEGAISSLRIGTSRRIRVVDLEAFIDDRVRQGP
jgi:excisionase family DNA binding protein